MNKVSILFTSSTQIKCQKRKTIVLKFMIKMRKFFKTLVLKLFVMFKICNFKIFVFQFLALYLSVETKHLIWVFMFLNIDKEKCFKLFSMLKNVLKQTLTLIIMKNKRKIGDRRSCFLKMKRTALERWAPLVIIGLKLYINIEVMEYKVQVNIEIAINHRNDFIDRNSILFSIWSANSNLWNKNITPIKI